MILKGSLYSNSLMMDTGITIITPNNYGQTDKYRVCYVLHGLCGGNGDYANFTMLPYYAYDKDVIYVCPETARGFYHNIKNGSKFFSYVAEELPETIKLMFNISAKKEDTAVIGGSMGGYGALKCALTHPERFGFCAAFAPCMLETKSYFTSENKHDNIPFPDFVSVFGENLDYDESADPTFLAEKCTAGEVKPKIRIYCGDEDGFFGDCKAYAEKLEALGYDSTFTALHGKHDMYCFNEATLNALDIFGKKDK